jgi:RimJ/RimL family protein N-acetyltransferase
MELKAEINRIYYDSIEEIQKSIDKNNKFYFNVWEIDEPDDDFVGSIGIWVEDGNQNTPATLMIHMTDNEALFLAEGIISMIKNKRKSGE